ncbi:MAG: GNAT family N-acetyltransferase [Comamonas sp.]
MHPSPPPLAIRPLVESDLEALLALYTHLHPADDALPPLPQVQAIWQGLVADPRNLYLGGFDGPQLVSSCVLLVIPNLTRGCRSYALIENVVTHAGYRQRGYGKALLHAALKHAWAEGCYKAMLMTGSKDEGTLRFYAEAGFDGHEKQAFVARPLA